MTDRQKNCRVHEACENLFTNRCIFVHLQDVIANALVELYEHNGTNQVSLIAIYDYGSAVVQVLNSKTNTHGIFLYSNKYIEECMREYDSWFERIGHTIRMKDGVAADDVRQHILAYTSVDVLNALFSRRARHKLLASVSS